MFLGLILAGNHLNVGPTYTPMCQLNRKIFQSCNFDKTDISYEFIMRMSELKWTAKYSA